VALVTEAGPARAIAPRAEQAVATALEIAMSPTAARAETAALSGVAAAASMDQMLGRAAAAVLRVWEAVAVVAVAVVVDDGDKKQITEEH